LVFLAFILLTPLGLKLNQTPGDYSAFIESSLYCAITGLFFKLVTRKVKLKFSPKEGFAIVTFGWGFLSFFGCLPYLLTEQNTQVFSVTDAFFETISGLSTTGASIVNDIENLPRPLLFWRSLTHWIGGMGVIVLFLAILPALGAGGFQLFRAEVPGPTKDKISPKIGNTAKTLWIIYVTISIACFICLRLVGMNNFDALCHTFATIATGGFSTLNNSIAGFDNWKIDFVITIFMFLSGCNFMLFLNLAIGRFKPVFKNEELRFYSFAVFFATIVITLLIRQQGNDEQSWPYTLMDAAFQVVCIITSTGYATADYDLWPQLCQFILLLLMIMGACAGSTGGGMKVFRVLVAFKVAKKEIGQLINPRAILPLKIDGEHISNVLTGVIIGFVSIFILLLGFFTFVVIACEGDRFDILSLFSICVSCLSNIGPGLDAFGPTDNYAPLKDTTKWILSFMMLLGRLELYSVLVILHPNFWKS
jgi:trk system potassium uptake protein TrkH